LRKNFVLFILLYFTILILGLSGCSSNYILSGITAKPTIKIFKNQDGQLVQTNQFSPMDEIVVYFTPPINGQTDAASDLEYYLRDIDGKISCGNRIGGAELDKGFFSFFAGGSLGKEQLVLKFWGAGGHEGTISTTINLFAETKIVTGNSTWDSFYPLMKQIILKNRRTLKIGEKGVTGYRSPDTTPIFLRDHTYQMKGFKYFESEIKSAIDYFFSQQQSNGEYLELVWENPKTHQIETLRNDVEADPEYLAVQAAYQIWQATGDDKWIQQKLPQLEKGLNYSMTDPFRWSKEYQLVKRPFTIDTWDFQYRSGFWPFDPSNVKMCIFHGDNSGMYDACRKLAILYANFGNQDKSKEWNKKADHFKVQMNKICWNGKFYTHQVHIDPVKIVGVDEKQILSLSNPYDINRGVTDHSQSVSIIHEYQNRKKSLNPAPFAEWFSIQPCFPTGGFETTRDAWALKAGQYVNGGIMPLVGGELANASFNHGFENYGVSILNQYYNLVNSTDQAYLWYYDDGKLGVSDPATFSSDGWGAAAMLNAFMEGLAGIHDNSKLFDDVNCTPHWTVANVTTATVIAKYGASNGYFAYNYLYDEKNNEMTLNFTGSGEKVHFSILLPLNRNVTQVFCGQLSGMKRTVPFHITKIESSEYLEFDDSFHFQHIKVQFK
jgi:hypothetical protein